MSLCFCFGKEENMQEKRAYQYKELMAMGFDFAAYAPMRSAGCFTGTLDAKAWGRRMNMVLFLTLDDGRKVIVNVWQTGSSKDTAPAYKGMGEVPTGSNVEMVFGLNSKGSISLQDIRRITPSV